MEGVQTMIKTITHTLNDGITFQHTEETICDKCKALDGEQ